MNILVYSDFRKLSHSVRPELEILLRLARMGHQLVICSPAFENTDVFARENITTFETGQSAKISPRTILLLRRMIRQHDCNIVFATNSRAIPSAAFASIGLPVKLVCYRGTTRGLKRRDPTSFLGVLHPRVDAVICVSNAVEQAVQRKLLRSQCLTTTIFKGHDLDWYRQPPAGRSAIGLPDDAFVAIAAARFRPSKGLNVLVDATHHLADLENFHLLVVGSGADSPEYRQALLASPMQDRIHLTGFRSDAPQLIAASDVLVQASVDGEGLPRSIMEGLAYGVPAISTTSGGAKEILTEGETGFVVPVRDPLAIADRIRELYNNREQLDRMSQHCRAAISGPLSCDASAEAYAAFFERLCSGHRSQQAQKQESQLEK